MKWHNLEEEYHPTVVRLTSVEMQEIMTQLEDNEPKDKRTKTWRAWKKEINNLMVEYNSKWGKMYKLIK